MPERPAFSVRRVVALLFGMYLVGAVLLVWHLSSYSTRLAEAAAREHAARYAEALATFRTRYTSEVVERVRPHGIEVTHDYASKEAAIPLPATLTIDLGEHIGKIGTGADVQLFSKHPFPHRTSRALDEFQESALVQLNSEPDEPVVQFDWEHRVLKYATADLMRASCVDCHNTHPQSPKTDWKTGDVRGVLQVTLPLDRVDKESGAGMQRLILILCVVGGIGLIGLGLTTHRLRSDAAALLAQSAATAAALKQQQKTNEELKRSSAELSKSNTELKNRREELSTANHQLKEQAEELEQTQALIADAVLRLADAVRRIRDSAGDQSRGAKQQATAVAQIVATVAELDQSAEQAAKRSTEVVQSSRMTSEVSRDGEKAVEEAVVAMRDVKQEVESIADGILTLSARTQSIGEIADDVIDIAEQTNVLALNAAVEASRAGEYGKSFAVVASEVKALAEQSKKTTGQVRDILEEIRDATNAAVLSIERGTKSVGVAESTVAKCDKTIHQLRDAVNKSSLQVEQIRMVFGEQTSAISQLNDAIQHIDQITQQNVDAISSVDGAAEKLNELSNELTGLTS